MVDFILNGILWTFALYGLFEIIKTILYIYTYTKFKSDGLYVIIAAKNQEEHIEVFLRTLLFRLIYGKEDFIKNIVLTDLGSTDKTNEIILKLQKEYNCLNKLDWKECKELIDNIEKN